MTWVTEMEGDIESDLSVFHRVDDMSSMGSRRWATLVPRLSAYAGAVQHRLRVIDLEQQQEPETQPQPQDAPPIQSAPVADGGGVAVARAPDGTLLLPGPPSPLEGGKEVGSSQAALRFSDIGDMFSFG